ncbi:MAG TPA: pilus assembly protein PilM [Candidatus Dormibacteraeota bacterium]|nr:pilus assembly protein PilM [Candidatus Dormibacteraeota bacterium]
MTAVIAMDLGAHDFKLVQLEEGRLTRHASVPLSDPGFIDGIPTPELSATVKRTLQSGGFTAQVVRVAIPDSGIAVRDFPLPAVARRDLRSAVTFEGRRLVPMNASDVYYAWHATKTSYGYGVYLVAARRDMVDAITAMIAGAGLRLERMDLKPLALARGADVRNGLVLEWNATEATLVWMVAGRPRFFRTFVLDDDAADVDAQFDELVLSVNALVKFMRTAEPDVAIGPATPLVLGGRFASIDKGMERARERFEFAVASPVPQIPCPPDLPWQEHLVELGLLRPLRWHERLTPSPGGDNRVAA